MAPTSRTSILLIEDNAGDALLLREALAEIVELHPDLIHTEALVSALDILAEQRPDVVLADLALPDAEGLEAVRRIRTAAPAVPLVVLTGQNDETLAVQSLKEGAQDYLVKGGIDSHALWRALRYAMERQRVQLELLNVSLIDDLTGLYNRRGFLALAEHRVKLANRTGKPFLIAFVDLDGLKTINDTFGHQEGDRALVEAATVLKDSFRQCDILARLGGDEFAAFIADAGQGSIETVSGRITEKLDARPAGLSRKYCLSFSIGMVSNSHAGYSDIETLLTLADALMYQQKRSKKLARKNAVASAISGV